MKMRVTPSARSCRSRPVRRRSNTLPGRAPVAFDTTMASGAGRARRRIARRRCRRRSAAATDRALAERAMPAGASRGSRPRQRPLAEGGEIAVEHGHDLAAAGHAEVPVTKSFCMSTTTSASPGCSVTGSSKHPRACAAHRTMITGRQDRRRASPASPAAAPARSRQREHAAAPGAHRLDERRMCRSQRHDDTVHPFRRQPFNGALRNARCALPPAGTRMTSVRASARPAASSPRAHATPPARHRRA